MYGQSGFYWFMGVVEDRNDPQYLGRCRIRIAGYNTSDKTVLPTEDLPWAIPLMPITSASVSGVGHAPIGPVEGTWVLGFFIDGEDAQIPVMLGTFPGHHSPINLTALLQALASALATPLTLSATGLAAAAVPVINAVSDYENQQTEKLNNMVTDENSTDTQNAIISGAAFNSSITQ